MGRRGLSFSLTLVVVGVILLITAVSVITLTDQGLGGFFSGVGDQQDQRIQDFEIQQACNDLKDRINTQYCDRYIKTAQYLDGDDADGNPTGDPSYSNYQRPNESWARDDYMDHSSDTWEAVPTSQACGGDVVTRRYTEGFLASYENDGEAYGSTASEAACNWVDQSGFDPNVNIQGNEFNCVERGHISSRTCPAQ